ncbi:MAG TPA: hypothetical protein PKE12_01830 [Kiritimatiellia bacterium]|nr:hypothetical protein [Kiritimatiellia bacterium]
MPFIAVAMAAMLIATWAGLVRLGWMWPVPQPGWVLHHGPLMVCGFLGTVIGVERAVALGRRWTFLGPLFTATGTALLLLGVPGAWGPMLIAAGSVHLLFVFAAIARIHAAPYTAVMAGGALLWAVGNALWLSGRPVPYVVFWWAGFLVLTIAGERLELGRVLPTAPRIRLLLYAACAVFALGLLVALAHHDAGVRIAGFGWLGIALWLLAFDVARRTVKTSGLTRFIAVCLIAGYVWLAIAGVLALVHGGALAGFAYDAMLHAVFVGFVISMIFGHAPVIFPAVTGRALPYSPWFYGHLALLHVSLLVRTAGDLTGQLALRKWGGLLNAVAILLFLALTLRGALAKRSLTGADARHSGSATG